MLIPNILQSCVIVQTKATYLQMIQNNLIFIIIDRAYSHMRSTLSDVINTHIYIN